MTFGKLKKIIMTECGPPIVMVLSHDTRRNNDIFLDGGLNPTNIIQNFKNLHHDNPEEILDGLIKHIQVNWPLFFVSFRDKL